jgi:DNA processing protein
MDPTEARITLAEADPGYPDGLLEVGAPVLRVQGRVALLAGGGVALVGARAASRRGLELAAALGREVARSGRTVISGGAIGVDAAAHQGALGARGDTVAVLGSGLDHPYPERNLSLLQEIGRAGALVSQFEDARTPRPGQFLARNRVIAGLAQATVVVEADARSGALSTARAAAELGRLVLAVPGSAGCDALCERGALSISSPEDLLEWLHQYSTTQDPAPAHARGQA